MKLFGWLLAIAVLGGALYWFLGAARPVQHDTVTGQVTGPSAPPVSGVDPASTLNNVRGAARRIEDDSARRAADLDSKTSP